MTRLIGIVAAAVVLGTAALLLLLWWAQERMVFQPPAGRWDGADGVDRRVDYRAADGQQLLGYVVGDAGTAPGLLIAFHGNADVAVRQLPWARQLHGRTGWAVLLAEYRGYGGLDGRPTAAGVQLDARAAYDAGVALLGAAPDGIALYAHSVGTPIAVELAAELAAESAGGSAGESAAGDGAERAADDEAEPPVPVSPGRPWGAPWGAPGVPRALLLESPFTSARDMARMVGPHGTLLFRLGLSRFGWDTETRVGELRVPVAVAHGARDGIVPVAMGRRVHGAAAVPGPLLIVEGAGHNDVAWQGGEEYWGWVEAALRRP
jgi:uncharacterized protein